MPIDIRPSLPLVCLAPGTSRTLTKYESDARQRCYSPRPQAR